ncbi:hypothetical protein AO372_0096 [Moraxella catarrhalis]|uniref:Uncharacterized protein n=1 Tax=Moraxella catarrhalis TaxID=480 RepID=A0AB36DQK2_MORCA|nr:hypothetical protein AO381_1654 [Moraxella catarrhalis]OAV07309.1 hypothetical protein AO379_0181 [Moraxella catarrhalis]OAV10403.1 hypothetical protein AO377_0951 [Moraxella catarrhalis]OAV16480.1 hypothetical protein AO376_0067 [Moraxella catarrhalis]OAV16679.1 hypothetical protein AO374_1635 [Moraxella catarrhalis]
MQTVKYDLHKIIMLLLTYCTIKSQNRLIKKRFCHHDWV